MRGMEQLFCFCGHFWVISRCQWVKKHCMKKVNFIRRIYWYKAPLFTAYTFAQKLFIFLPFLRQETAFYVPQSFCCVYRYHGTKCFEKKKKKSLVLQMQTGHLQPLSEIVYPASFKTHHPDNYTLFNDTVTSQTTKRILHRTLRHFVQVKVQESHKLFS